MNPTIQSSPGSCPCPCPRASASSAEAAFRRRKSQWHSLPLLRLLWLLLLATWIQPANAEVTHLINSVTLPDNTGFVIASDAANNNEGYDRDAIAVRAAVTYSRSAADNNFVFEYQYRFRLLDGKGVPQQLRVGNQSFDAVSTFITVNRTTQPIFNLPIVTNMRLTPAGTLSPNSTYRVELRLLRRISGSIGRYTDTETEAFTPQTQFIHFTSTVSSDIPHNVIAQLDGLAWSRTYLVTPDAAKNSFRANTTLRAWRYDGFNGFPGSSDITFRFTMELRNAVTDEIVPLQTSHLDVLLPMANYSLLGAPPLNPVQLVHAQTLDVVPATQLDSVAATYVLRVSVAHFDAPAALFPLLGNNQTLGAQRLLQFNGRLWAGDIETQFGSIANNPAAGALVDGGINSTLSVNNQSGFVVGNPGHTYGNGNPLSVSLRPNGDAHLSAGSFTLTPPAPDTDEHNNIQFNRGPITLTPTGGSSTFTLQLPGGVGWAPATAGKLLSGYLPFVNVELDQNLLPKADPEMPLPANIWITEETKPVWMQVNHMKWHINLGRLEFTPTGQASYVRANEYDALQLAPVSGAQKLKRSNERYYQYVEGVISPSIWIHADDGTTGNEGAGLLTATFRFKPGNFQAHFPRGAGIAWGGIGEQYVEKDLVNPDLGGLPTPQPIQMSYLRDCPDGDCPGVAGSKVLTLNIDEPVLQFSPDGGLYSPGKFNQPTNIEWGWIGVPAIQGFAQRTAPSTLFSEAGFLMAGSFLRGDQGAGANTLQRPGVILFTGFTGGGVNRMERPNTAGYAAGLSDYPGFNFRTGEDGAFKGRSILAGKDTGEYPLTGRSKYYTRSGGVSGIHEAVFGQFPAEFQLYGYKFNFSNYGLSYLDSSNVDSRTEGFVEVPGPSNFIQDFEQMKLGCLGELLDAKVPASDAGVAKLLQYWQSDFYTKAIKFDRKAADSCDPGKGVLTLGVEAFAVHVEGRLQGIWGFHPNGNLISRADCDDPNGPLDPPFDSRLKVPNQFKLRGPGNEKYNITPVSDAYLSNWKYRAQNKDSEGNERPGFVNIAAKMDVPFFEDLQVHIHTSANSQQENALIHLMGGWSKNLGYTVAGKHFFNDTTFDRDNRGFPNDATVPNYQQGSNALGEKYRVRAVRTWLDVVTFDIPMKWSSTTRAFTTYEPVTTDLLVVSAEYQAKYLSAQHAELAFGIQYKGIPQVNLANMAFDQLDGLQQAFQGVVQAQIIDKGFGALNSLIAPRLQDAFDPVFDSLLDPIVDNLYQELAANFNTVTKQWINPPTAIIEQYCGLIGGVPENFKDLFENKLLGDVSAGANGFIRQIDTRLADAVGAIGQLESLLAKAPNGNRTLITQLTRQLVTTLVSQATDSPIAQSLAGFAADMAGGALDEQLNGFLEKADPTLEEVRKILATLKGVLNQARGALANAQSFEAELKAKLNQLVANNEVILALNKACQDITGIINTYKVGIDNPFTPALAAQLKAQIRQRINDRFFGSAIPAAFTSILKQRLYDVEAAIHEATDSLFQQVNSILRETISQVLSGVDNKINGFLGSLGQSMGAGRLNGYAHIVGDSLKELRIDLFAQLKIPSEMEFNAYLQIRELESDNAENGCIAAGEKATEVRIGAKDVDLNFISSKVKASIEVKFTFKTVPNFSILGAGAGIELNGELKFATFKITYLGAQAAFGSQENYFSGACGLSFSGYKAKGGIYFGRTCTLDPFFWDTDVQEVIGKPPFTGVYAYGEVWIPISEALLGIPASCFFEVSAGIGLGAGFFIEGPTFVGKMMLGCYGSVLCLASIEGQVKLVGVKNPDGLQLKGSGRLKGCLGPCPFCICINKSVNITYKNSKWGVKF